MTGEGIAYTIEQVGQALKASHERIAELSRELAEARAALAEQTPPTD